MNIWSVIVVGLQLLKSLVRSCYWRFVCWTFVMISDLLRWKHFDICDVDVSLMMIWCFLDIVMFLLAIFEMLLDVKVSNSLFPLIFFLRWSSRINAMLRVVFFDEYFCKVANLKLNFVESVICFEFECCWAYVHFSLKPCWKLLFEELPVNLFDN